MTSSSFDTQEWYLEVEGRRIGPFLGQQIADLFKDGEILSRHKVISLDASTTMTVEEFIQQLQSPGGAEPAKPDLRPGDDPEVRLFDALQAARERKHAHAPDVSAPTFGYGSERNAKQTWWVGALLAAICILAVWGLVSIFRSGTGSPAGAPSETERVSSVKTQTTPVAPPPNRPAAAPARPAPQSGGGASYATTPSVPAPQGGSGGAGGGAVRLEHNHRGSTESSDHSRPNENRDEQRENRDERDSHEGESQPPQQADPAVAQDPATPDAGLQTAQPDPETVAD